DHIGPQIIAERIGVPVNAREELLHAVWRVVAGRLGEVPAVLPLQGGQQTLKIGQGASARLRTPEQRGNPPATRLQLLSPVLGFAPARHGHASAAAGQHTNPAVVLGGTYADGCRGSASSRFTVTGQRQRVQSRNLPSDPDDGR